MVPSSEYSNRFTTIGTAQPPEELSAKARAVAALYREHRAVLLGVAEGIVRAGLDGITDAEDLVQTAMAIALEPKVDLDNIQNVAAWLTRVVSNEAKSRWRRAHTNIGNNRQSERRLNPTGGLLVESISGNKLRQTKGPEEIAVNGILHADVRIALAELTARRRQVAGMFYYDRANVAEIAAATGLTKSQVKNDLLVIRDHVRKRIRRKYWDDVLAA